ncbi:hypothetical protein ACFLRN_05440 [Thermoproteota archaeon]
MTENESDCTADSLYMGSIPIPTSSTFGEKCWNEYINFEKKVTIHLTSFKISFSFLMYIEQVTIAVTNGLTNHTE